MERGRWLWCQHYTEIYNTVKMGRISHHTVLKYTAHTHRISRANMEGILSICLQQTWMNSKILTWDEYASPSLLTDFTSLYCLHHIMSYYFHTLLSTNIYIYTDTPWLILGFWGRVCKVITSFRNNSYMYTNSPLVQQYKVSMHQTYKQNNVRSIILHWRKQKLRNKVHQLARTRAHTHTMH